MSEAKSAEADWKDYLSDEFLDVGPEAILEYVKSLCKSKAEEVDRFVSNPEDQSCIKRELAHYGVQLMRITPYTGDSYF